MQIIFNKEATDHLFVATMEHNLAVIHRRRVLYIILSVVAGTAFPMLTRATQKALSSLALVAIVCGLLLPSFFRDFIPAFKPLPIHRPDFLYAALMGEARNVRIEIENGGQKKCRLSLYAEMRDGRPIRTTFDMPTERKSEIVDAVVDFENNTVYLPLDFDR